MGLGKTIIYDKGRNHFKKSGFLPDGGKWGFYLILDFFRRENMKSVYNDLNHIEN